jgi:hypothetical protein
MPLGDLPGWRQVFAEDFTTTATTGSAGTTGSFQQVYGQRFGFFDDTWNMTAGCAQPARYMPSKVLQARNGVLQLALHSEVQADPFCGQGTKSYALGAAILPKVNGSVLNQLYGKYTVRFRSDSGLGGFRPAWLLWPQSEIWPRDGELDFPEGDLAGNMCGFVHYQNGTWAGDQTGVCTNVPYTGWHTASIEWSPNLVRYILDDVVVLQTMTRVPNTPMHWVMQTEACWDYCPPSSAAGNLEIDWAVMYAPAP